MSLCRLLASPARLVFVRVGLFRGAVQVPGLLSPWPCSQVARSWSGRSVPCPAGWCRPGSRPRPAGGFARRRPRPLLCFSAGASAPAFPNQKRRGYAAVISRGPSPLNPPPPQRLILPPPRKGQPATAPAQHKAPTSLPPANPRPPRPGGFPAYPPRRLPPPTRKANPQPPPQPANAGPTRKQRRGGALGHRKCSPAAGRPLLPAGPPAQRHRYRGPLSCASRRSA